MNKKLLVYLNVLAIFTGCKTVESENAKTQSTQVATTFETNCNDGLCGIKLETKTREGGFFDLQYKLLQGSDASFPTIIFLTGGPGGSSVNDGDFYRSLVPAEFSLLLIEQRESKQLISDSNGYPSEFFATKHLVNDVASIISHLKLNNYALWGSSYGTLWVSEMANYAEKSKIINKPKFLVLEGTLGRAINSNFEGKKVFFELWNRLVTEYNITPQKFEKLKDISQDNKAWGKLIGDLLVYGFHTLGSVLTDAIEGDVDSIETLKRVLSEGNVDTTALQSIYHEIACKEIMNDNPVFEFTLDFGTLALDSVAHPEYCNNLKFNPFDANQYELNVDIFYFNGGYDPATPTWQAQHHKNNAKGSGLREYFDVIQAGHGPLHTELRKCSHSLWYGMNQKSIEKLKTDFNNCSWIAQFNGINLLDMKPAKANIPPVDLELMKRIR